MRERLRRSPSSLGATAELMTERNRRFLLRQRPTGCIDADAFELSEDAR